MTDSQEALGNASAPLPPKQVDLDTIETAIKNVLRGLGQDGKVEVMDQTPRRVAELYAEVINPGNIDIEQTFKVFDNPGMTDLVLVNDVHYVSYCEHHLAASFGIAHVGYVPDQKIVGYSKLKKGLNYLARQPQLNERLLVDTLDFLEAGLQPKGVGLVLRSTHTCLALKANAPSQEVVTVSDFRGVLREDSFRNRLWASAFQTSPSFLGV